MAGTPEATVYNRAFAKIGVNFISDPNENSPQARVARPLFGPVARQELRKHTFSFALARAALPALATPPAWGYAYAFQLPADCLRLVEVAGNFVDPTYMDISQDNDPPFVIEGRQLLTNLTAPLQIRYVRDLSDSTDLWDDAFVDVFACALGTECAPNLTKSDKTVMRVAQAYKAAVADAKRVNAIELPPQPRLDSSWVTSRAY